MLARPIFRLLHLDYEKKNFEGNELNQKWIKEKKSSKMAKW